MQTSPEDMPHAFARAWTDRDAARLASLFAEDADFVNVVGIWWEDRAAIERAHHYGLTTFFANSRLTVGRVKTRALGPDHALVHARFRLTGQTAPDGEPAGPRATVMTLVMERRDGRWLCLAAQNTDIVPGAETHLRTQVGLEHRDYRRS